MYDSKKLCIKIQKRIKMLLVLLNCMIDAD